MVPKATAKMTESSPVTITILMIPGIGYFKASNTNLYDHFGSAVSLSAVGYTLVVEASFD